VQRYLKALYGAAVAAVAAAQGAYVQGGGHIGLYSGLGIAGAALAALAVVWAVPNKAAGAE
jgi:hypothetical protein